MRVAKEGFPFIGIFAIPLIVFGVLGWWIPFALWIPFFIWVIAFFRDPIRDSVRGADLILAPADGKVVSIIPIDEPAYLGGKATRVAIFMNVFNVHVNRYPVDGVVEFRRYTPGKFLNAGVEKASTENEQSSIGMATSRGKLLMRQIAGLVARRIITDHSEGHRASQGERLGLIRFGSRVDIFLPPNVEILVKTGDLTIAAETVVAKWKS